MRAKGHVNAWECHSPQNAHILGSLLLVCWESLVQNPKIWRHSGDTNASRKFTLRVGRLLAAYLHEILVSAEGIEPSTY